MTSTATHPLYSSSLPLLHYSTYSQIVGASGAYVIYDTFSFKLTLPPHSRNLEFCVCYKPEGQEFWDSNSVSQISTLRFFRWLTFLSSRRVSTTNSPTECQLRDKKMSSSWDPTAPASTKTRTRRFWKQLRMASTVTWQSLSSALGPNSALVTQNHYLTGKC